MHCWLTSLLEKVSRRRRIIFYPSIHLWVQPYLYVSFILFCWYKKTKLRYIVKNRHWTSTQNWNSFLKNQKVFNKNVLSFLYSENWIWDAKRQKTLANTNYFVYKRTVLTYVKECLQCFVVYSSMNIAYLSKAKIEYCASLRESSGQQKYI